MADIEYEEVFKTIEFDIQRINETLGLVGFTNPDPGGFLGSILYAEHLLRTLRVAAINYERHNI